MAEIPDLSTVVQSLKKVINEQDLDPHVPLANLNVDSLDLLEWLHELEESHELQLNEEFLSSVSSRQSVEEIYQLIVEWKPE